MLRIDGRQYVDGKDNRRVDLHEVVRCHRRSTHQHGEQKRAAGSTMPGPSGRMARAMPPVKVPMEADFIGSGWFCCRLISG